MKKLMCAMAVAAVATGLYAIESDNIVGYSTIEIPTGWSTFTPIFDNVSGGNLDWMSVELLDKDGNPFDSEVNKSQNQIQVRLLTSGCILDNATYQYTTRQNKKWCRGTTALVAGEFTIASGQGVLVNNTRGEKVHFRVAGEVRALPQYTCPSGWSVWGNNTPVPVDFKYIRLLNSEGVEFNSVDNKSQNEVVVRLLTSDCVLDVATYQYTTRQDKKWCRGTTALVDDQFVLQPGEAFLVNNTRSSNVQMVLPSPTASASSEE